MTRRRTLFIHGLPKSQGSKKHVGNGRMVEQVKGLKKWRKTVHDQAMELVLVDRLGPLDGPIRAELHFYLPRPKGHPKTKPTYPDRTPDLSKLIRAVEDSLTTARWWTDDARVVEVHAYKHYSIPRELTALTGEPGYGVGLGVKIVTHELR